MYRYLHSHLGKTTRKSGWVSLLSRVSKCSQCPPLAWLFSGAYYQCPPLNQPGAFNTVPHIFCTPPPNPTSMTTSGVHVECSPQVPTFCTTSATLLCSHVWCPPMLSTSGARFWCPPMLPTTGVYCLPLLPITGPTSGVQMRWKISDLASLFSTSDVATKTFTHL